MPQVDLISAQTSAARGGSGANRKLAGTRDGALFAADYLTYLTMQGLVYYATDADANDRVTGQTSFADTTPTFLLEVPSGKAVWFLGMFLDQAGTVAGAFIEVNLATSSSAAYASGGTAEAIRNCRSDNPQGAPGSVFYSGPTATTGKLINQVASWTLGQDVSPAEGAVTEVIWTPQKAGHPLLIVGPGAVGVFTWAGTTGPTWNWHFAWAEVPSTDITG